MTNNEVLKFDAIVIGTGISGGWAAKELCENGLKTLVLERGRMVEHIKDYPTANLDPWDFEHRGFSKAAWTYYCSSTSIFKLKFLYIQAEIRLGVMKLNIL